MRAPTARLEHPVRDLKRGHTKVRNLDIHVLVEKNVLRLQISVGDVEPIKLSTG